MDVNLKSLIGKLNATTRGALEGAAGLCLSRTHYDIEIQHFLAKLVERTDGDIFPIFNRFNADPSRVSQDLSAALDRLKSGNADKPAIGPRLVRMLTDAWTLGSVDHGAGSLRSGFVVLALLSSDDLRRLAYDWSGEFKKLDLNTLSSEFGSIVAKSSESVSEVSYGSGTEDDGDSAESGPVRPGGLTKTPNLDQYTHDLTAAARSGKIDPVLAREFEIRQVVDILTRRRQNNPILVGEAGVGKTAVVEGFALRVVAGDVPEPLKNVSVRTLDLALLQAGAGIKGEFENRLKSLIQEVKASPSPIILFIDEAHTMIGAGGQAGQGDAANLLKPALARGELRTIAATTWAEYKKYFEKDAALARRFQPIKVEEPSEEGCLVMMRGVLGSLEAHHGVRILDTGLAAAVRLSARYLPDRQLPDKAVSVLDTAAARLALSQSSTPSTIEGVQRKLDDLAAQKRVLEREVVVGADHAERLDKIAEQAAISQGELAELEGKWRKEQELVVQVLAVRKQLEESTAEGAAELDRDALRKEIIQLMEDLAEVQGEKPLVRPTVDDQIVAEVIADWTGIPVGKMLKDEVKALLELEQRLGDRVIGQNHALKAISQRIRTARAALDDPCKPVGVFLFVGPSGVGKTETALALSDLLYGGEHNIVSINMSEFQEAHTVSSLKGSPPGYVGYGEGGVLTEAVRRRPYSVVLLDEVEKAHPDVLELFFQVFDKGVMEDGEGRIIDFKNTTIVLTSNAGTESLMSLCANAAAMPAPEMIVDQLKPELDQVFKPAFLGRLVIIPYYPVRDEVLKRIIHLKLNRIKRRLADTHGVLLDYDEALVDQIASRCTEVESGARNVDNILTHTLLPDVASILLGAMASSERPDRIAVGVEADGSFAYDATSVSEAAGVS